MILVGTQCVGVTGKDTLFVTDFLRQIEGLTVLPANWGAVVEYVRERKGLVVHVVMGGDGCEEGFQAGDVLVNMAHEAGHVERLLGDAVGVWLGELAA